MKGQGEEHDVASQLVEPGQSEELLIEHEGVGVEAVDADDDPMAVDTDDGVKAGGKVDVKAKDNATVTGTSSVVSVAASFSAGGGASVSLSGALVDLGLNGATRASIEASRVQSQNGQDVTVSALSTSTVTNTAVAVSVAFSGSPVGLSASGAGASAKNTVNQEVKAKIAGGSTVISANAVTVKANDNGADSTIDLDAVSVSVAFLAAIAIGAGEATIDDVRLSLWEPQSLGGPVMTPIADARDGEFDGEESTKR